MIRAALKQEEAPTLLLIYKGFVITSSVNELQRLRADHKSLMCAHEQIKLGWLSHSGLYIAMV